MGHLIVPFGEGQQRAGLAGASFGSDLHPHPQLTLAPAKQVAGEARLGEAHLSCSLLGPYTGGRSVPGLEGSWEMTQIYRRPALSSSSLRASHRQEFKKKYISSMYFLLHTTVKCFSDCALPLRGSWFPNQG